MLCYRFYLFRYTESGDFYLHSDNTLCILNINPRPHCFENELSHQFKFHGGNFDNYFNAKMNKFVETLVSLQKKPKYILLSILRVSNIQHAQLI